MVFKYYKRTIYVWTKIIILTNFKDNKMNATNTQNYYFNKIVYFDNVNLIEDKYIVEEINYLINTYQSMHPSQSIN
jgi:hypothetical protein